MSFLTRELAAPTVTERPSIAWEEPNCLLCNSYRRTLVVEAPDHLATGSPRWFAVVQCDDCGLYYTSPRPSPQSIAQFYPAVYWPRRAPGPLEKPVRPPAIWRRWRRGGRRKLPLHGAGRLLDFGCGGGRFLERMHRLGWKVTGLDISPAAVQRVRHQLGLPALVGSLPHPDLQPASFDTITMWHSLEHVHDPREVLRQAYFLLAPGGQLIVAVPNIESLAFHWFRRAWYGLDLPRHLTHFAPTTLRWMLERTGFHVGPVKMIRQTAWLRASASLAAGRPPEGGWKQSLQARPVARLAAAYSCLVRQSDCMLVVARREE